MSMTTWTKEQVAQVEGLRVTLDVDSELVARHPEEQVTADIHRHMSKALIQMAQAFGVDVHPGDCQLMRQEEPSKPWSIKVTCAWRPTTNAAELRGGQADGEVFAIQRIGEPLRIPIIATTPWLSDGLAAEGALVDMTLTYEFTGEWDETARHWIYGLR